MNRVGIGHDTHRLEAGRKLILGGILVEYPRGLSGHSDADIVLHALTDVIIGKQRIGPVGEITLTFNKNMMRFENFAVGVPFDN